MPIFNKKIESFQNLESLLQNFSKKIVMQVSAFGFPKARSDRIFNICGRHAWKQISKMVAKADWKRGKMTDSLNLQLAIQIILYV